MPTTPIDDVLDHILQICSTSSLAVISRVSFHTRELALPHLLRRVCLDRNPQQVLTFLNFIIDNAHDSDLGIISDALKTAHDRNKSVPQDRGNDDDRA